MSKFEQLIEYVINSEENKARELFHDIVVSESRRIYESLIDEDDFSEVEDEFDAGIEADEEGFNFESEEDFEDEGEEMPVDGEEEFDFDSDGEIDQHEGEHADVEDRVVDLEAALDELRAEFETLMGGDAAGEEDLEVDAAGDFGGDVEGSEGDFDEYEDEEEVTEGDDDIEIYNSDGSLTNEIVAEISARKEELIDNEGMEPEDAQDQACEEFAVESEDFDKHMNSLYGDGDLDESDAELARLREYTEKITKPANAEPGDTNKRSNVANKNDMGGTTANIVKGSSEEKGRGAVKTKGEFGVDTRPSTGKISVPKTSDVADNKTSIVGSRKAKR